MTTTTPTTLYYYTGQQSARQIANSRYIRPSIGGINGYDYGVYLSRMNPVTNSPGDIIAAHTGIPGHIRDNSADYYVEIDCQRLDYRKLRSLDNNDKIYCYTDQISIVPGMVHVNGWTMQAPTVANGVKNYGKSCTNIATGAAGGGGGGGGGCRPSNRTHNQTPYCRSNTQTIPSILYHYTTSRDAQDIRSKGEISLSYMKKISNIFTNGGKGILLTTMAPNDYYRSEILTRLYTAVNGGGSGGGGQPDPHCANRADWCVRVIGSKLKPQKLVGLSSGIYVYSGDIHVCPKDVMDKPKCNKAQQTHQQQHQQQQHHQQNGSYGLAPIGINPGLLLNPNIQLAGPMQNDPVHIYTRRDQLFNDTYKWTYQDDQVVIVAPKWVEQGLQHLSQLITSTTLSCKLIDSRNDQHDFSVPIGHQLTLKQLVMLARNESGNTSGRINFQQYGSHLPREVILSIKDLARQCIIVGPDSTTHYGGYPRGAPRVPQTAKVYLIDLVGLQFQQPYNSGRLVTHGYRERGVLDDFIYEQIMGQPRPSINDIHGDRSGRFVSVNGSYFDILAYINFVANDVYLCGMAVDACAHEPVNFKFVKYGTGFYAPQPYKAIVNRYINAGVSSGFNKLLDNSAVQKIASIELPFFDPTQDIIDSLVSHNRPAPVFGQQDALKQTNGYLTATTNCADGHCITGNEMGFNSVDSAIAENLLDRANKFSPVLNERMTERYIQVPNGPVQPRASL